RWQNHTKRPFWGRSGARQAKILARRAHCPRATRGPRGGRPAEALARGLRVARRGPGRRQSLSSWRLPVVECPTPRIPARSEAVRPRRQPVVHRLGRAVFDIGLRRLLATAVKKLDDFARW